MAADLSRLVATVRIYISALIAERFRFGCHKKMAPKIKHKREIKVSLRVSCQHQLCHARSLYIHIYIYSIHLYSVYKYAQSYAYPALATVPGDFFLNFL